MGVTVCSERSSCPCLCSGVDEKSVSRSVGSWDFQGAFPVKEKYRPCSIAMDFVGWNSGKMNRVCCGAVDLSGIIHGEAVFKMNTTTSCGKVQTNPQEQWDLQEKYHCVWKSSRGFWKICWSEARKVWHILWLLVALGKIRYVNQNKSHFLSAVNSSTASCNRMLLVHSRRRRQ